MTRAKYARRIQLFLLSAFGLTLLAFLMETTKLSPTERGEGSGAAGPEQPQVRVRPVRLIKFPAATDCNSPSHWDNDTFYLFNSAPSPWRSSGPDLFHLGAASETHYDKEGNGGRWIESTWKAEDGTLYGWYHNEPHPVCQSKPALTAPRIGAARSKDNGTHWEDLGFVIEAPPYPLRCDTEDKFFAGGNGDFSVIPDEKREYVYFFFSSYYPDSSEQGIDVARMRFADRDDPAGKVWKWYREKWVEPGVGGHATPVFPVRTPWHRKDVHAFWGPSIHWNTHLDTYVVLMNYAIDRDWTQGGIYVSFNHSLANPRGWNEPKEILNQKQITDDPVKDTGWYPQVVGIDKTQHQTDKLAGKVARLFIAGKSRWEILLLKPGESGQ
jgi:hypothetical protein